MQQDQHIHGAIPESEIDTSCSLAAGSQRSAVELFKSMLPRMVDPASWRTANGAGMIKHVDEGGNELFRELRERDYLQIGAYDHGETHWVRIERIERRLNSCSEWEVLSFKLRPVTDPLQTSHPPVQQHLPENEYCLLEFQREKDKISVHVHGREVISADHWQQFMQDLLHQT